MGNAKRVTPDVVITLTDEQRLQIQPLLARREAEGSRGGMILGSVGLTTQGKTIALSYIPQRLAQNIVDIAFQELEKQEGKGDVESEI